MVSTAQLETFAGENRSRIGENVTFHEGNYVPHPTEMKKPFVYGGNSAKFVHL